MEKSGAWIREVVSAPLEKIYLILGFVSFLLSFNPISYDKGLVLEFKASPNWWLLILGLGLIVVALYQALTPSIRRSRYISKIKNGFQIKLDADHAIDIVVGEIENVGSDISNAGIVLPVNTSFDDECILDSRSALGAFVKKHFPSGIEELQQMIKEEVKKSERSDKSSIDHYPVGTTIFLEKPLGSNYRIMVTAVTQFSKEQGFVADNESIIRCMKSVLKISAGQRLSKLYMPVIGSGHGGVDFNMALGLILIFSVWSMKHEEGQHIKQLTVVILDPSGNKSKKIANTTRAIGAFL